MEYYVTLITESTNNHVNISLFIYYRVLVLNTIHIVILLSKIIIVPTKLRMINTFECTYNTIL